MSKILPRQIYAQSAVELAPKLLGKLLVREIEDQLLISRIVEVEAYMGGEDTASHASRGPTPRNRTMFGPPGHAYVYLIYGVHHCLNIVTGPIDSGQAVLIRALEPLTGVEFMQAKRKRTKLRELTNGPGKLCQALDVDKTMDGHDLCLGQKLWVEDAPIPAEIICASPRIGISGDEAALARPWRFFLHGNNFVSPSKLNRHCIPYNSQP